MEAVIFVGIQASGKSTFYVERFFKAHVRINLDMLRTRHRERILLDACLAAKQSSVVDNTNPTAADRSPYIQTAKAAGFETVGYYFQSKVDDCLSRNANRPEKERVPDLAILGTYKRLEVPALAEGFDRLFCVSVREQGGFTVRGVV